MASENTASAEIEIPEVLSGVVNLYEESLDAHGISSKSVGWKDQASQVLRFEKLVQVIDPQTAGAGISVNDFGCGYGAMFQYLDSRPSLRLAKYYGYDISDEMLATARQAVTDPRAVFIKGAQVTEDADYSFVSGTFNVKLEASDELWANYIKQVLVQLAAKSAKGFAFNVLSTYVDWKQDNLFYADPFEFFNFCKSNISRYVSVLHDYPLYEWTLLVRTENFRT